jgi:hypothetical protein
MTLPRDGALIARAISRVVFPAFQSSTAAWVFSAVHTNILASMLTGLIEGERGAIGIPWARKRLIFRVTLSRDGA